MHPATGPPPTETTPPPGRFHPLPLPRLSAQLQAPFVQRPVAVHAPGRELAAVGVQRQCAVAGDPRPSLDERSGLAVATYPEGFEPCEREKRETVVQLGE